MDITGGLRSVARQGYQYGELASFCFSPDESEVIMALPLTCSEWWLLWDEGEGDLEPEGAGRFAFDFGELRVRRIADGEVSVTKLRVSAADGWSPSREAYDPEWHPRFLLDGTLVLSLPWADLAMRLPGPATLVVAADTNS